MANTVLAQPSDSDPEAIVRTYKRVMVENGGVSLNIDQLKQLALVLVHRTAIGNPTVGGADQIAVLTGGKVQNIVQPTLPTPTAPPPASRPPVIRAHTSRGVQV